MTDAEREREKLAGIGEKADEEIRSYACMLYLVLFELSRAYQESLLNPEFELGRIILDFPNNSVNLCANSKTNARYL